MHRTQILRPFTVSQFGLESVHVYFLMELSHLPKSGINSIRGPEWHDQLGWLHRGLYAREKRWAE